MTNGYLVTHTHTHTHAHTHTHTHTHTHAHAHTHDFLILNSRRTSGHNKKLEGKRG